MFKTYQNISFGKRKLPKLFIFLLLLQGQQAAAQQVSDRIKINQAGYYPAAPKVAVVTGDTEAEDFYITSTNLRDTFFSGKLSAEKQSAFSATKTKLADFSGFKKSGTYTVLVPGVGHSYVFGVGENVHHEVAVATLKGFYFQRVSMPLEPQYAGKWHRSAGHPDNVVYVHPSAASTARPAGTVITSPGGWYDAGDYNKYIVNSGITMGTLLSAYEDFPQYFKTLNTNIPESGDALPDILNEVAYNLRWMLTMQDPNDGGVYHKCTNAAFDGMIMPGITRLPRYVVQKSTAAALDFAAVLAQASRVYKSFEKTFPRLSDSCLKAAQYAWQWAQKNPAVEYNQNEINKQFEPKVTTGAYGDRKLKDEWFWAAAEMLATTGGKVYYDSLTRSLNDSLNVPSWSDVHMLGVYTLLRQQKALPAFAKAAVPALQKSLKDFADGLLVPVMNNAFGTVMGQTKRDFIWGSSAVAANQSIVLINAYAVTKDAKYLTGALTSLDYLLGRNATGYCFVTGMGSKSTMHPHHRPSIADGVTEPVPGLLAGGPNPGMQDGCKYEFTESETAYTDVDCSYASNEIAINWNAPIVYLANAVEALQKNLKTSGAKDF